ncbi:MAG: acyl dehydratase [Polaromonas sp.]|nr:acyl dehydratase [Polaromonas sp.]
MTSLYFDDVEVGTQIGSIDKGVMTTTHIMRWSAAIENFHRIHYDHPFATGHDGLPGVLVNGSWKQHILVQMVKDSVGPAGWLWKLNFRYKKMDIAGDAVRGVAEVVAKEVVDGLGFLTMRVKLVDQNGTTSTAGTAIAVVPVRGGPPVPYPFEPKASYDAVQMPADA